MPRESSNLEHPPHEEKKSEVAVRSTEQEERLRRERILKVLATEDLDHLRGNKSVNVTHDERAELLARFQKGEDFPPLFHGIQAAARLPLTVRAKEVQHSLPEDIVREIDGDPVLSLLADNLYELIFQAKRGSTSLIEIVQRFPFPSSLEAFVRERAARLNTAVPPPEHPQLQRFMKLLYGKRHAYWQDIKLIRDAALRPRQESLQ